ncbi:MAG: ABC transporter ATP-binding protein [Desulforudis sp.]|nr:MAG: ABC transporter ATP-binding protein [Desulforudis sp.]
MSREVLLQLLGVWKTYRMGEVEVPAMKPTDLEVYRGEILVILGPSGSGKSTLLNIMGGIDQPSGGQLLYEGKNLTGVSDNALTAYRRHHVGFIFQFFDLISNLTVSENVALGAEIAGRRPAFGAILDGLGLGGKEESFPAQLSGGEQQRVAIARALAKEPDLLLCDEPTGSLDYRTGIRVLHLLHMVSREMGKTVVIITHNTPIGAMADRVITMRDGFIDCMVANEKPVDPSLISW